jgi:hypothetical protein
MQRSLLARGLQRLLVGSVQGLSCRSDSGLYQIGRPDFLTRLVQYEASAAVIRAASRIRCRCLGDAAPGASSTRLRSRPDITTACGGVPRCDAQSQASASLLTRPDPTLDSDTSSLSTEGSSPATHPEKGNLCSHVADWALHSVGITLDLCRCADIRARPPSPVLRRLPLVILSRSFRLLCFAALLAASGCEFGPTAVDTSPGRRSLALRLSGAVIDTSSRMGLTPFGAFDPGLCYNGPLLVTCCPGPIQVARAGDLPSSLLGASGDCIAPPEGVSPGPIPPPPGETTPPPGGGVPPSGEPPIPLPPPGDGGGSPGGNPNWGGLGCQNARAVSAASVSDPLCPPGDVESSQWMLGPSDPDYLDSSFPTSAFSFAEVMVPQFDCVRFKCPRWDVVLYSPAVANAVRELRALIRPGIDIDTEYGAFLFRRADGTVVVGPYLRSTIPGRFSPCDGARPETTPRGAIGCIHTHYSDVNAPNSGDLQTSHDLRIYVLVSMPSSLHIFGQDGTTTKYLGGRRFP